MRPDAFKADAESGRDGGIAHWVGGNCAGGVPRPRLGEVRTFTVEIQRKGST